MKISKVSIKNCLGLKELDFSPTDITLIEGKSGSGKTSVIESISQFLTNNGERPEFVHQGASKGEVYIEFDNGLKGKKVFKGDGKPSSVTLEQNGMQPKGAETFLKSLFNPSQINPIEFISKKPKEQTEIILNAVPMELPEEMIMAYFNENLAADAAGSHALKICKLLEDKYFNLRKESSSQIKYFESDIAIVQSKLPPNYGVEAWREASLADIITKINTANDQNRYLRNCQKLISEADHKKEMIDAKCASDIATVNERILQLNQQITEIAAKSEADKSEVDAKVAQAKEWARGKEEIDTSALQETLAETERMKSFVALADDLAKKQKWLADEILKNADYENKLVTARALPQQLIKSANLPVEDMGINEDGEIIVKGRPIKNLSGAERLDFAINIAKLTCGQLKTILINGFEAMDGEMKEQFLEKARADNEYQYIIADVADGDLQIK